MANGSRAELRKIQGNEIGIIFQEPMTSLNPLKTIGKQIQEALEIHQGMKGKTAVSRVYDILRDVGISRRFVVQ